MKNIIITLTLVLTLAMGNSHAAPPVYQVPFHEYIIISGIANNPFSEFIAWKKQKGIDIGTVGTGLIRYKYFDGDKTGNGINDLAGS
ncbi:MAG: hypothetical protein HC831_23365, partial [Chloroflexia bacterium]|nr:hypothetical protein [Chloroflexia bacterium]